MEKMCLKMDILEKTLASIVAMKEQDVIVEKRLTSIDEKVMCIDEKVKYIANSCGGQCVNKDEDDVTSADLSIQQEDRKRLKEKLKEAMDHHYEARAAKLDRIKPDWMEYIFGICRPDGRLGKEGSR